MVIRVRFAPSPTGDLHLGGFRTALFNYLFARRNGGQILLRLEDTDQKRLVPHAQESIMKTFNLTGINFDEDPVKGGPYAPYIQSHRTAIYQQYAQKLLDCGHAYRCFCTPERLAGIRDAARKTGRPPSYDRLCRSLTEHAVSSNISQNIPHTIRLKVPSSGSIVVDDLIHGKVEFDLSAIDDQVLLKSCGLPTYHLANVVDDHLMRISHVIRGEEWLTSTPKHLLIYRALDWTPPEYAHVPLILNSDKSKLSKRRNDKLQMSSMNSMSAYLPEAIVNFAALIGWSPGDDFKGDPLCSSLNELTEAFSLKRISKINSTFDLSKLNEINRRHTLRLWNDGEGGRDRLLGLLKKENQNVSQFGNEYLIRSFELLEHRLFRIQDLPIKAGYLFSPPTLEQLKMHNLNDIQALADGYDSDIRNMLLTSNGPESFLHFTDLFSKRCYPSHPGRIKRLLRHVITADKDGPRLHDIMDLLGAKETHQRILTAISLSHTHKQS